MEDKINMNIYRFYIVLTDELFDKIYRFVDTRYIEYHNGKKIYLYAWTNKKSYYKNFLKTRNMEIFVMIESYVNKDTYDEIKYEYKSSMLTEYKEDDVQIIITNDEKVRIQDDYMEYIEEYLMGFATVNPDIFKGELYRALSNIIYTYLFSYASDSEDYEMESYNLSYNQFYSKISFNLLSKHILIHNILLNINGLLRSVE